MKRIGPEKIHLLGITLLKANFIPNNKFLKTRQEPDHITVGYSQKSRFDFKEGSVLIILDIKLTGKDQKNNEIGLEGQYSIEFLFSIENFKDFVIESKETVNNKEVITKQVDGILGGTLMGICYSTARGIILERTQGTPFQNRGVIIPVINPNDLLMQD
ncbi:MAG: hypothetical protein GX876_00870 [Bacteroidales bacterium]|nr:hypothetical protein [Bacteroidales bacterium]